MIAQPASIAELAGMFIRLHKLKKRALDKSGATPAAGDAGIRQQRSETTLDRHPTRATPSRKEIPFGVVAPAGT